MWIALALLLGLALGWFGRMAYRWMMMNAYNKCPYCLDGYFASRREKEQSIDDTHRQSSSFRP